MILTPDQFREHVVTAVEDDALKRLLDAAESAITEVAGPSGADVVELVEGGRYSRLLLSRPAAAIVSVREASGSTTWYDPLDLEDDYTIATNAILRRVNSRWSHRVEVTYTPLNDAAKRMQAQIKLVELDLNYAPLLAGEQAGPYAEQRADNSAMNYELERQLILSTLRAPVGMLVID